MCSASGDYTQPHAAARGVCRILSGSARPGDGCIGRGGTRVVWTGKEFESGNPAHSVEEAVRLDSPCRMVSPAAHKEREAKLITIRTNLRSPVSS